MRILIFFLLFPFFVQGQPPTNRYQAALFPVWVETDSILFSTHVPQPNPGGGFYEGITGYPLNVDEFDTTQINLYMNIFEPVGDTLSQRPVIIICFGGGFLSGSKDHWSIRLLCQELARRGYVTAAIDYRLGMNVFDSDLSQRAVYRGVQDARSAVRFFRADADGSNTYRVDPDQIFLGGHSSGAFMALHNAYLDEEAERPISTYDWIQDNQPVPDQLCLDCVGDNQLYNGHGNAIFSLAGALGFTDFIDASTDPKVVMFHSTDDGTVPYDSGEPFSSIIWLVIGSDLPTVYGSLPISLRADTIGLPYQFYSYTNRGHDVHENGSSALYADIIPGISDWFFEQELKPAYDTILGDPIVCSGNPVQDYSLSAGNGVYFEWGIMGGSFLEMNSSSQEVLVEWDTSASAHTLSVVPYSHLDAKGDSLVLEIQILDNKIKMFLAADSNWESLSNWSFNQLPSFCDHVVINPAGPAFDLTLSSQANIHSITLGENLHLAITLEGALNVNQRDPGSPAISYIQNGVIINQGVIRIKNTLPGNELQISETAQLENLGTFIIGSEEE